MGLFVISAIVLVLFPAAIAHTKGAGFFAWWVFGTLLFIVALPWAIVLRPNHATLEGRSLEQGNKKCPYCAEIIKGEASVCRYCGRDLPESTPESPRDEERFAKVVRGNACGACGSWQLNWRGNYKGLFPSGQPGNPYRCWNCGIKLNRTGDSRLTMQR